MTAPDKAEEEYNFGLYLRTLQSSRHSEYIFNMTVSSVTGTADFFSLYSDMPDTIKRMENMQTPASQIIKRSFGYIVDVLFTDIAKSFIQFPFDEGLVLIGTGVTVFAAEGLLLNNDRMKPMAWNINELFTGINGITRRNSTIYMVLYLPLHVSCFLNINRTNISSSREKLMDILLIKKCVKNSVKSYFLPVPFTFNMS